MSRKVAIVTADSRVMGAAIARQLHEEGYQLTLMARSNDLNAVADKTGGLAHFGSTAVASDLQALVKATVDAIVCNTGHSPKGDLSALSEADWRKGFDIMLMCLVHLLSSATPYLEKSKGSVVAISAFGAVEPSLDFPVSSVAKAALGAYIKLYSERYAAEGIRINAVLPGFIDTFPVSEERIAHIPAKRPGTTEEVARTVSYLLSGAAGYVTGQSIRVDGGLTRSL